VVCTFKEAYSWPRRDDIVAEGTIATLAMSQRGIRVYGFQNKLEVHCFSTTTRSPSLELHTIVGNVAPRETPAARRLQEYCSANADGRAGLLKCISEAQAAAWGLV
jgi:hypothetical protein